MTTKFVMMVPSHEQLRWGDPELVWVTWWTVETPRRELKLRVTILDCVPGKSPTKPLRQAPTKFAKSDICSKEALYVP